MQLQAYAACDDPNIRAAVRTEFVRLVRFVQAASGAPDDAVQAWLARGMLMNVGAAMDLEVVDEDWARMCLDSRPPSFRRGGASLWESGAGWPVWPSLSGR